MKTRLLLALALLAAPCAAQAQAKTVLLTQPHFLCQRLSDADQFARLAAHGDAVAFTAFIRERERENIPGRGSSCRYEDAGERLTVSDSSQGSVTAMECFRPSGYAVCYWGIALPAE
ncbi:hypothetical protein [Methylorubrum extorquens]|uniref:hypothetical protein n=1 Tax=Methylorubrum extorquens TaxID=408 RepID=UPI00209FC75F|nr:hypothetical protein [Methylorubrum extorquens]MCP1540096.1 hypothetical protein [Methylorubrum extorquens]